MHFDSHNSEVESCYLILQVEKEVLLHSILNEIIFMNHLSPGRQLPKALCSSCSKVCIPPLFLAILNLSTWVFFNSPQNYGYSLLIQLYIPLVFLNESQVCAGRERSCCKIKHMWALTGARSTPMRQALWYLQFTYKTTHLWCVPRKWLSNIPLNLPLHS